MWALSKRLAKAASVQGSCLACSTRARSACSRTCSPFDNFFANAARGGNKPPRSVAAASPYTRCRNSRSAREQLCARWLSRSARDASTQPAQTPCRASSTRRKIGSATSPAKAIPTHRPSTCLAVERRSATQSRNLARLSCLMLPVASVMRTHFKYAVRMNSAALWT